MFQEQKDTQQTTLQIYTFGSDSFGIVLTDYLLGKVSSIETRTLITQLCDLYDKATTRWLDDFWVILP